MGGAGSVEDQKPPKAWEIGAWAGLFIDPYADGIMGAGDLAGCTDTLAELLATVLKGGNLDLNLWNDDAKTSLAQLQSVLAITGKLAMFALKKLKDADALAQLASFWESHLGEMQVGAYSFIPCGWQDGLGKDNTCVLIVERVEQPGGAPADDSPPCAWARLVLINTGEGTGVYHPNSVEAAPDPKIKCKTAFVLGHMPLAKITDPIFLSMLVTQRCKHESHKVEMLYEALLPWLIDKPTIAEPLASGGDDAACDWRTPARSKTTGWRSLMEACRYMMRRKGVEKGPLKQLSLQLRRALLGKACKDLQKMADPNAARSPQAVAELLMKLPLHGSDRTAGELLADKRCVGLYFSAHWCPPCRGFTPQLRSAYEAIKARGEDGFEVVFISRDKDETSFAEYFAEMPWCAARFQEPSGDQLMEIFEVQGIPSLILITPTGEVIDCEGRGRIQADPTGQSFPWTKAGVENDVAAEMVEPEKISPSDRVMIKIACRQMARAAIKEHNSSRLQAGNLASIEQEIVDIDLLADRLVRESRAGLPPAVVAEITAPWRALQGFDLLCGTGEDRYRGQRVTPPDPRLANMLDLPTRVDIDCFAAILDALSRAEKVTDAMLARARDTGGGANATSASRLAIEGQVISLIQSFFTEVLPIPLPPSVAATGACPWTVHPITHAQQLECMQKIYKLMHRLGEMWQDVEEPTRLSECVRATAAACAFAMFDTVVRQIASDSPMTVSALLVEGGGALEGAQALSTGVGRTRGLAYEQASERLELISPALAHARADSLAYFVGVKSGAGSTIFDLPLDHGGEVGLVITVELYGPTCEFLLELISRCGYERIPEGQRPPTEMDSIMMWFGSHPDMESSHSQLAKEHPEWMLLRDTCILFKFLYSMLPLAKENMQLRKEAQDFRGHLPLSFNPGSGRTGGRGESMDRLFWDTATVRGIHHHIADLTAYSFYTRKITWGEGSPLRSPANVGTLLDKNRPTEEDILHCSTSQLKKARFDGTLSAEEAEALMTCLVAPYVRVPLVAHFFADLQKDPAANDELRCGNKASFLFNERLQALFRAAMLEQGTWVPDSSKGSVVRVPMRRTERQAEEYRNLLHSDARRVAEAVTLGSPSGLLLNELKCSPEGTLRPLIEILRYTQEVSNCSLHSNSATFTLFMLSLGVFTELFGNEAMAELAASGKAVSPMLTELGDLLRGLVLDIIEKWIDEASKEVSTDGKRVGNLPTLCVLHAHRALLYAPCIARGQIDGATVASFVGSLAYVRGRHCFGQQLVNVELSAEESANPEIVEKKLLAQLEFFLQSMGCDTSTLEQSYLKKYLTGAPVYFVHEGVCIKVPLAGLSERSQGFMAPPAEVPEQAIADILQYVRRPLVQHMEELPEDELGAVLSEIVWTALGSSHSVPATGWLKVDGHPGLYKMPHAGIVCDAQAGEILYQSEELRPVPDSMSSFADFELVFGKEALQCAFKFTHEHRRWIEIVGEEHELLEWDAPMIDAQGIGAPAPLPGVVFKADEGGPPAADVFEALQKLQVVDKAGTVRPALEALADAEVIGIYFSAHWCPPCRGFTPKLGSTYEALARNKPGGLEIVFVSSDRSEAQFNEYFSLMKWQFAVPYSDGSSRQSLGELFQVQGIPSLCFVTPAGHVVCMNGRDAVAEDPKGKKYPWGNLQPPPEPASDAPKVDAITYLGMRYNRPFVWYHPGKVFPAPPPDPEPSEAWVINLLQPVLEALFPSCPPDKRMTYVLYMPELVLAQDAEEMILIGMADESKDFATWKEVHVNKSWEVVHCYNLVSHGRRVFRTLIWSSHGARSLATMKPMHLKPSCSPIPACILDAAGDWKLKRMPDPSLVIVRQNHQIGGRETFLPPRLLAGIVPGAFLDAHQFWQSEDLVIRGYPNNDKDEWFPYALEIKMLEGTNAQILQCKPDRLSTLEEKASDAPVMPALRRTASGAKPPMLNRQRSAGAQPPTSPTAAAGGDGGSDAAPPPAAPVLSRNKSTTSRLAPLLEMGFSEEMATNALDASRGPDGRENYDLAVSMLLGGNLPPAPPAARDPSAPLGTKVPTLGREISAFGGVAGSGKMVSRAHKHDHGELVLMDLFHSAADSALHRLAKVFARVEDLGHILVWGRATDPAGPPRQVHQIVLIELPRLKLKFQPQRTPDGSVKIYSLDHTDWFLSDLDLTESGDGCAWSLPRTQLLATLLTNIPHSLLLENATKELQVLVPAWELRRPKEKGAPFGTHLIFNRGSEEWANMFTNTRCFLYPVHATRAFLMPKTLDAQLYLILLRFYGRQYLAAHRWATSIAVDVSFVGTEFWVFRQFQHVTDGHPDAHALRIRMLIAIRFSPDADRLDGWESHEEFDAYLRKHPHVSAGCALTPLEELQGIRMLKTMTPTIKIRKAMLEAHAGGLSTVSVAAPDFQVGGEPWNKMVCVSEEMFKNREWLQRFKFQIPAEDGGTTLLDAEALMPIFENLLIDDDEAGNTRKLGFLYLYALAIGQLKVSIGGRECGLSMAQIMTRALQLKLAHWGKRAGGTELEAKLSKQCAVLSLVFDFPAGNWPRLPLPGAEVPPPGSAPQESGSLVWNRDTYTTEEIAACLKLLVEGIAVDAPLEAADLGEAEDEGEQSEEDRALGRGKIVLWGWHVDLKDTVRKILEVPRTSVIRNTRRDTFKTLREAADAWICAPREVQLATLASKIMPPFAPSDLACDSYPVRPFECTSAKAAGGLFPPDGVDLSLSSECVQQFAAMPLGKAAGPKLIASAAKNGDNVVCALPFPVSEHPAAAPAIAKDMLSRLEKDLGVYKKDLRDKRVVHLQGLGTADVEGICAGTGSAIQTSLGTLEELVASLNSAYESGTRYVENAVTLAATWAQFISEGTTYEEKVQRCEFRLKQRGGLVLELGYELLVVLSLSTKVLEDVSLFNPFVQAPRELLDLVIATEFHGNRLAQNARTSAAAASLRKDIATIQQTGKAEAAQKVKLPHSVSNLLLQLGAERYCLDLKGVEGAVDPRLLVFEFLSSFLLRERQVEMIRCLKDRALKGESSCQQMIMGAGKTTVVGPLLVLCLADGATAVLQTMPSALLEMTRNVLREVFAYPLPKQVFTLQFDRTQDDVQPVRAITEKLELAMKHRGVVVAAPEAIKSLTLKMIEMLHSVDAHGGVSKAVALSSGSSRAAQEQLEELELIVHRSELADACAKVLALWKQGVVIMDEVDVLLHPLRSELNFPIGDKVPVDLSGDRWELPLYLLNLIFIDELDYELKHESPVDSQEWKEAEARGGESRMDIAAAFRKGLSNGVAQFSLMTLPHLTLMDTQYYHDELAIVVARFCMLWIHRLCSDKLPELAPNAVFIDYMTGKADLTKDVVSQLQPETMKRLNLASDWIMSIMPHCLSRVNRVAYGLLSKNDKQPASAPESRRLMAVPFLAKDVPSMNSEFAHPDVVIGLTILAFRHEGLRVEDLHRIVKGLKADFARQIGPRSGRPANIAFEGWREEGRAAWARLAGGQTMPSYLGLELFQPEDSTQMMHLHRLLTKRPQIVHYYLTRMVFPDTMNFHRLKVSACGHELGSSMIFTRRIGFSGTPSNLLPEDLRDCMYEPGSDGKIIEVLTDPKVVSCEDVPKGWTARSLLAQIATAEPAFHALIDTGALVTGLENAEVAQFLLEELPEWYQGVVYLDKSDRQMVLLRTSGRAAPLKQCGLPLDRRFTFYDQIHTTGMDIKQAPNARAALTIGKDMVFRDYAQGAWRMRGIGIGQTISLMIIPEVQKRIQQDLKQVERLFVMDHWEVNVPAWLLINSMRSEGLQEVQLNLQELHNVYRKRALEALTQDAALAVAELPEERSQRFSAGDARAKKLHAAVEVFREQISNELDTDVPQSKSLRETFDEKVAEYEKLGVKELLGVNEKDGERIALVRSRTADGSSENTKAVRGGLDQTREQQQEKEQEQQQMKEREQEEEQMTQFCRDEEAPLPWPVEVLMQNPGNRVESAYIQARDAGEDFPFSKLVVGNDAFFPMALFHATSAQPQLPFPRHVMMSSNYFRPRWAGLGDRRLKNIPLVVEWLLSDGRRVLLVPSLSEAETIRRLIHNGDFGVYGADGLSIEKSPLSTSIAVRTLTGHKLDFTDTFRDEAADCVDMISGLQCVRFFHGDMFFSDAELRLLMTSLAASAPDERRLFFEECIRRRRRERREWSDTPIARVFVTEAEWATLKPRALIESVRANVWATLTFVKKRKKEFDKLSELAVSHLTKGDDEAAEPVQCQIAEINAELRHYPTDIAAVFDMADLDQDKLLNRTEFMNFFKQFNVHPTATDIPGILQYLGSNTSSLAFAEFEKAFAPKAAEGEESEMVEGQPWQCPRCPPGLLNPWENIRCVYCCVEVRPGMETIVNASAVPSGFWECKMCHLYNEDGLFFCTVCNFGKDAVPQGEEFD